MFFKIVGLGGNCPVVLPGCGPAALHLKTFSNGVECYEI